MASRASRRMIWAGLVLVAVALLLPPFVNVNRYKVRAAQSISRALRREVTVSNIELKLLPRPGLVLYNFVVAEDPGYGAEPMLRAPSVTAYLRLTSLWRGRLEIGTLDLDNPSLNLVRRPNGHWNLEELVQRASSVPSAPTNETRPEARPRFPYVEASLGRINFKLDQVKKAFAFTDADFALWQDSEDQWGIRLKARPMRTDVGISDTGTLKLDGRFQRASTLRNTPVNLKLTFTAGPVGQVTTLVYGRDRGWRGSITSSASVTGTPAALGFTLDAQVDDFRRYDISLGEALRLRVHCTGTYSSPDAKLSDVQCQSPVGTGVLTIRGNAQGWAGGAYEFGISAVQIPAARLAAFARHAKKDLPTDLTATGDVEAVLTVRKSQNGFPVWEGGGRAEQLVLHSAVLQPDMQLGEVQFVVPDASPSSKGKVSRTVRKGPAQAATNAGFRLAVKPFAISLGAASPATGSALFDNQHYTASLSGEAELARLLNIAKAMGVGTPGIGLAGRAEVDLAATGNWAGFAPPTASGKVQVRDATAELQGVSEPLHVSSAAATLANETLNLTSFTATFTPGPQISGSARFPVHCLAPETCVVQFDVRSDDASFARLYRLLNPSFASQPWYHLLSIGQRHEDALLKLRAHGRFSAARFELGSAVASNVSGTAELNAGKLRVSDLRADLLGGRHTGTWVADFTQSPPKFAGSGTVSKLSMAQLATLMHDNWATGTTDARYALTMFGLSAAALRGSANGSADFSWNGGSLRHVTLDGRGAPMAFSAFSGTLALRDGKFNLTDGKLLSSGARYSVKGTASYDRTLDVRLERAGGHSYVISGTLDKPQVESVTMPAAEAALR